MRILVTGSVGSGKTTATKILQQYLPDFQVFNLSDVVIQNNLFERIDKNFDTHIPDEDRLMDYIRDNINPIPNFIIDHHSFDIFGNVYFNVVIVITCLDKDGENHRVLRQRLESRGYSEKKILENIEVEIMGAVLEDVRRFKCIKFQINNNGTEEELQRSIQFVADQIKSNHYEVLNLMNEASEEEYEEYEDMAEWE